MLASRHAELKRVVDNFQQIDFLLQYLHEVTSPFFASKEERRLWKRCSLDGAPYRLLLIDDLVELILLFFLSFFIFYLFIYF